MERESNRFSRNFPPKVRGSGASQSAGVDSFRTVRARAATAARLLQERGVHDDVVALVGHGMMNILIARELRAAGWRGPRMPSRRHWGFGIYERNPISLNV